MAGYLSGHFERYTRFHMAAGGMTKKRARMILLALAICALAFTLMFAPVWLATHTILRTDESARASIEAHGVTLPDSAKGLYYAFQPQFADHLDTWISFSASATDCKTAAEAIARTKAPDPRFIPGTRPGSDAVAGGPAYHHPEYASAHWDLSTVANGTMFETNGLFVLIDKDRSRVYIALRAP